jgi:hypothetical protein
LYSSPGIIRMVKSQRIRWTGCVVRMGEKRNAYGGEEECIWGKSYPRNRLYRVVKC